MANRHLHPREEPYRWAIEKLDEAFGQEHVNLTPRNHYHIIKIFVSTEAGRSDDLDLRDPQQDLNKRENREAILKDWIAKARRELTSPVPAAKLKPPKPPLEVRA
jgi:hypothetical protein